MKTIGLLSAFILILNPITALIDPNNAALLPLCCEEENKCTNNLTPKTSLFKRRNWVVPRHLVSTKKSTKFRFIHSFPCSRNHFTAVLPLLPHPVKGNKKKEARNAYFTPEGQLKYQNEYYRKQEYCISGLNENRVEVRICSVNCSNPLTPCIQKCCGLNQIYSFGYGDNPRGCVDLGVGKPQWLPTLYDPLGRKLGEREMSLLNPHVVHKFPTNFKFKCRFNKTTVFPHGGGISDFLSALTHKTFRNLEFRVRNDGWLLYPEGEPGSTLAKKIENYCVDGAQDYGESQEFSNLEQESILFLCSGGVEEAFDTLPAHSSSPSSTISISTAEKPEEELDFSDSSSSSLEIEIEDGVPLNSLEEDEEESNPHSQHLLPALLKIAVQVPQENDNFADHFIPEGSEVHVQKLKALPTCCSFTSGVNDGFTHHCRNKRNDEGKGFSLPVWNVPEYFMTRNKSLEFPLKEVPLKCGPGNFQFQGFIHNFEQKRGKTSGERKAGIFTNGFLKYDNEFYNTEQYCINGLSPKILEVLICKPDCSMWETPCVRKCCGIDEIYNLGISSGNRGCQPLTSSEASFSPTLYKSMTLPASPQEMNGIRPHFIQKYPPNFQSSCYNKITLAFPFSREVAEKLTPTAEGSTSSFKHLLFRFRKDGKLMYTYPEADGVTSFDALYDRGEYCVDGVREGNTFKNYENQTILFICASQPHSGEVK